MLKHLFIILCVLNVNICWILDVNQNIVTPRLSTNINIICRNDNETTNSLMIKELYRIRIQKLKNENEWDSVAEMSTTDPDVWSSITNATTTGKVDKLYNSFIKIHFDTANQETVGQFWCEIDGFDEYMNFKEIKTETLVVAEHSFSQTDLLNMIHDLKNKENKDIADLKNGIQMLKESMHVLETKNIAMSDTINNITARVDLVIIRRQQDGEMISIAINNITNRLDKIESDLQTVRIDPEKNNVAISNLTSQVKQIYGDLQRMKISWKQGDEAISTAVENLTDRVDIINRDLENVTVDRKLEHDVMSISVANLTNRVERINTDFQTTTADQNQELKVISTDLVNLTNYVNTINSDFQVAIVQQKQKENAISTSVNTVSTRLDIMDTYLQKVDVEGKQRDNDMTLILTNLRNQIDRINVNLTSAIEVIQISHQMDSNITWPTGKYALLKPKKGCPNSFTNMWQFSSLKISTQPKVKNKDLSSTEFNLSGDVFQRIGNHRYVQMEMCSMVSTSAGPSWPKGSYCVQVYWWNGREDNTNCPVGFRYGYTRFGRYDDGNIDVIVNLKLGNAKYNNRNRTYVEYCCRNDTKAIVPIVLPRLQPFFLYRFGGTCQRVVGMKVTNQWLQMDTRIGGDYNSKNGNQPDSFINNAHRLEFCYYTPLS